MRRHVEHGIAPFPARDADDHLPSLHHLAGLCTRGRHNTRRIHPQLGIAQPIFGGLQLRLRGLELRARGLQHRLGLFELGARGDISGQERFLPIEVSLRLVHSRLGRRDTGLCSP